MFVNLVNLSFYRPKWDHRGFS